MGVVLGQDFSPKLGIGTGSDVSNGEEQWAWFGARISAMGRSRGRGGLGIGTGSDVSFGRSGRGFEATMGLQ